MFKKYGAYIVGLGVPVIMVVGIFLAVAVPRMFQYGTSYNFVFSSFGHYVYPSGPESNSMTSAEVLYYYDVKDGKLQLKTSDVNLGGYRKDDIPKLYVYDVTKDTYSPISFEDAQKLQLDSMATSPDGYEIKPGQGGGIFPFFLGGGNDYNARYITKGSYSKKLNLPSDVYNFPYYYSGYSRDNGVFGWVVGGGK